MKNRTSVLNRYWRDHNSDKYGFRGHKPPYVRWPCTAVQKGAFSFAMTVMDKVEEGWNEDLFFEPRCVHVDLHQSGVM